MTIEELLNACKDGMVKVKCTIPIKGTTSNVGQVTTLRKSQRDIKWKGCSILFPGLTYDIWFEDDTNGVDGRKHYMHQLEFVEP